VAPLVVAGAGISMAIPAAQNALMRSATVEDLGTVAGVSMMMRQLGGVLGVAITVAVFAGNGSYASPGAFAGGFGPALGVAAAFSLLGAGCGLLLRRRAAGATAAPPPSLVPSG
jgi:hypothetical protein